MAVNAPPRRKRSSAWIVVLLVAAALFVGLPLLFCSMLAGKAPAIKNGTVLSLRIEGDLREGPANNPFAKLTSGGSQVLSLHELRQIAEAVKKDDKIAGVMLEIGSLGVQFGTLEDVRDIIADIRSSKKPVQAILTSDFIDEKSYYVAIAADRIVMNPESGLALNGFDAAVPFYYGTIKKLHADAQFIGFKKYKSAVEPYTHEHMSPEFREVLESILGDYHQRLIAEISARRGIDPVTLQQLFDKGGLTATEAVKAKLIDDTGWWDQVEEALRSAGAPDAKEPNVVSGPRYLFGHKPSHGGDKIAVIYAVGAITAAHGSTGVFGGEGISGPDLAETIRDAADDTSVKAILMRVNSPGGSAVGSDFIRREIVRAKKKKPFVVSMGGVAGSGGYWIAMDADEIVAQPSTITGSIGVFFGKFNLSGTYNWAGANVDEVKVGGANSDILSPYHNLTAEQEARMKAQIGGVYDDFVNHVAEGRKKTYKEIDDIAGGRIWTGSQGKGNGLVDEVGGFNVALEATKAKAKITGDAQLIVFPKEKSGIEALADLLSGGAESAVKTRDLDAVLRTVKTELETPAIYALTPEIEVR